MIRVRPADRGARAGRAGGHDPDVQLDRPVGHRRRPLRRPRRRGRHGDQRPPAGRRPRPGVRRGIGRANCTSSGTASGRTSRRLPRCAVDQRPRQLTLFDSPDDGLTRLGGAANDLRYKLPRLDLGRETRSRRSSTTTSPRSASATATFPGSARWSTCDCRPPDEPTSVSPTSTRSCGGQTPWRSGGSTPPAGPWWSPLLGGDPATVGAYYEAEDADGPAAADRARRRPVAGVGDDVLTRGRPARAGVGHEARRRRSVAGRGRRASRPPRTRCSSSSPSTSTTPRMARPSRWASTDGSATRPSDRRTGSARLGRSCCCGTSSPAITR